MKSTAELSGIQNYKNLPNRFELPSAWKFFLYFLGICFFIYSLSGSGLSGGDLVRGVPNMARLVGEMTPPEFSRIRSISLAMLQTFQMALVGATIGIIISFFLAVLASRRNSPHPALYYSTRFIIAFCRSVPDLVWAVLFVASVGLGVFAGTLTIIIDTIGFCGRFFAEAMEEVDQGPEEALQTIGATRLDIVMSAVVPAAMPSFVNSSLFAIEKAVRSSVVLGLVGAGGIGIELKVAMDMFEYQTAATIILSIFLLVIAVEQFSITIRSRFM
ncbi:MAG: phosphonate ABC transporter, permease protein PhnE [Desulfobulbaceae bacterium]|nr:MAG: phosphonate ABC transporter, permease protein PhnE [Desulfobulbaceae bacterium]